MSEKPNAGDPASQNRRAKEIEAVERLADARKGMLREIHKVIVGQDGVIDLLLTAMFCRGHCLMVGVPGLAKTLMISTLARVLKLSFNRIQFTPDLMPTDITGSDIIETDEAGKRHFRFVQGPIFSNLVLADEINRTPPKTQAALLEAMQERQVTAGGRRYPLEAPFFVLATQNPIEQEGTYPLPEAQLDRFMFTIHVGYPTLDEEREIVRSTTYDFDVNLNAVLSGDAIVTLQQLVRKVPASDHVIDYALRLVRATRPKEPDAPAFVKDWLSWGAGPRAAQFLVLGAKARAILQGRYAATCADIRGIAAPVLRHRLFTNFNADSEGITADDVVKKLIEAVKEPDEKDYR
ncbi:MAG: MoxR family ATPase [Planctomycetota bacterium]|nr:MoxR family ATPase [Planctomycetota bacterium]